MKLAAARSVLLIALSATLAAQPAVAPPDVDAWVARSMRTFEVPGLALAIVKDDAVVLAKGYGVRPSRSPRACGRRGRRRAWTRSGRSGTIDRSRAATRSPTIRS